MMFRALAVSTLLGASSACVNPTGLGSIVDFNLLSLPTGPGGPGIFASAIMQAIPALASYETPVQARLVLATVTPIFNAAAAFEPNALDIFGRADVSEDRRRCAGTDPTLFDQHRQVTLAYAVLWSMQLNLGSSPSAPPSAFEGLAISWGLNLDICDSEDCSDITTPWGLADSLVKDSIDVYSRDGWNADGSLNADFNRVPYSDWRNRPYEPSKGPFKWQPLQETNGLGFSFRQEHVTPHIGFTAKSFFVGDQKVCSRRLRNPRYKYNQEIRKLLQRSAALDDRQKMEIEFFDSKFTSLVPLTVQYFARRGISLDSFEWILYDTATIAVIYEAVLQAWRVKVQLDLIRPTTLVQRRKKGQTVIAYQGPASGGTIGPISGEDWQPYIRVMPHAEYPSGSSCICKSFARASILLLGTDDITSVLGGPLVEAFAPGASKVEPGITPSNTEVFEYSTWTQIADRCGLTRLEGGMHFEASVPDGESLCEAIGDDIVAYFQDLEAGQVPSFTADVVARPKQFRCPRDRTSMRRGGLYFPRSGAH